MHLLYYWRPDNYYRDLDMGAGYHLNQANPLLHQICPGESLWAFTRNKENRYVLAAELVIKAKTHNPPNFRYGRYRVWGDIHLSRYFQVDGQPGVEQVIRNLSVKANAYRLAQSFQGRAAVRPLTEEDNLILRAVADDCHSSRELASCRKSAWKLCCSWAIRMRWNGWCRRRSLAWPSTGASISTPRRLSVTRGWLKSCKRCMTAAARFVCGRHARYTSTPYAMRIIFSG
jgi:hypothetical protein